MTCFFFFPVVGYGSGVCVFCGASRGFAQITLTSAFKKCANLCFFYYNSSKIQFFLFFFFILYSKLCCFIRDSLLSRPCALCIMTLAEASTSSLKQRLHPGGFR